MSITAWRRKRAARLLLPAVAEGVPEGCLKSVANCNVEAFLWRQMGEDRLAAILDDAAIATFQVRSALIDAGVPLRPPGSSDKR